MRWTNFFLILFCLLSISFSKTLWESSLDAPVQTDGVIYTNRVLIGSEDGFVSLLSLQNGQLVWKRYVGIPMLTPIVMGEDALIITQQGKLTMLRPDGTVRWTGIIPQASVTYGAVADADVVYATTDAGIFRIQRAGNITKIYAENGTYTEPILFNHNIVFGKNDELRMINPSGANMWRAVVGTTWKRPVAGSNTIYVATTDKTVVAVSNGGNILWKETLDGYGGTPILSQGNVWVAGTDWAVHKLNGVSHLIVQVAHGDFVSTSPQIVRSGGQEYILFGGKYQSFMFNQEGIPVFSFPVRERVVGLTATQTGAIIAGDSTGKVVMVDADKGCAILTPEPETILGKEEQKVTVAAFSRTTSISEVEVRVNDGVWQPLQQTNDRVFEGYLSNTLFEDFSNIITCRVTDAQGVQGEPYGELHEYKDPNAQIQDMRMTIPTPTLENKEFEVQIVDKRGTPLEHVTLTIDGTGERTVDGSIKLSLQKGEYTLRVEKEGYRAASAKINVRSPDEGNQSLLPIIAIGIVIVVALFIILQRIRK